MFWLVLNINLDDNDHGIIHKDFENDALYLEMK